MLMAEREGEAAAGGTALAASAAATMAAAVAPASAREKLAALRLACEKHVSLIVAAMEGKGLDRHLFALYVVAVGTGTESAFLKEALGQPWRLSTSQVPQQQTQLWDMRDPRFASAISAGGGFAPVADDGYGVSYSVAGEDEFVFHVSACVANAPKTSAARFTSRVMQALADMRAVLSQALGEEDLAKAATPPTLAPAPMPPALANAALDEGGTGSFADAAAAAASATKAALPPQPAMLCKSGT